MNDDSGDRDPFEELAAEFTDCCRRGEQPSVEEYAARRPEMACDIRELFGMILQVERAKSSGAGSSGLRPAALAPAPTRLGDFRIIREIGHGGMGVVYEAEQESLGRRVAIKVLPQQYLSSPVRRERFEREARTAAQLHHTNIVQIFGVGEQDGHPYFVMQYIRGVGLDLVFRSLVSRRMNASLGRERSTRSELAGSDLVQVARELLNEQPPQRPATASGPVTPASVPSSWITGSVSTPGSLPSLQDATPEGRQSACTDHAPASQVVDDLAYWRTLARLLAQAADALSFAHRQGVLHRDVKPGNLLLDTEGMLWVADFGLAKAPESQELTQAGDAVGTLRYMAPEQHVGQADERSDVYGLGITLYELATLSMAFVGSHGRSDLRAIMQEPLLPPRRLCPSMPRDLETIILKAVAREPQHRYASAAALRDDLLRFVEDRPILARRISSMERLWRWARRNPALATTTALALALLVSTATVASVAYFKVRRANSVTRTALIAETRQRERAEATADLAVAALDAIFDEFAPTSPVGSREVSLGGSDSDSLVVTVPSVLSPETATFLKGMLRFYRGLAQQGGASPSLLLKMAAAPRRVGEICELLGQHEDAKAAYADSIEQYERLRKESPDDVRLDVALARTEIQLGLVYAAEDETPQASRHYHTARRILQARLEGGSEEARFELARAYYLLSRPPSAGTDLHTVDRHEGRGEEDRPGGFEPPERRRGGPLGGGVDKPMPPPVRPSGPVPPPGPPPPPLRDPFLPGTPSPGRLEPGGEGRPDPEKARLYLRQAVELLARLSKENPKAPGYRLLLAQCLREPQGFPPPASQPSGAGPVDQAVTILENLVAQFPHAPQYQFELSETYRMPVPGAHSVERVEKARAIMEGLVNRWPNVPSYRFSLGQIHLRLWQECPPEQKLETGLASLKQAIKIQTALVEQYPAVPTYVMALASYESVLARWHEDQAQYEQARRLLESAVSRMDAVVATEGHKPHVRGFASLCRDQLARVYQHLGDSERARKTREKWGAFPPGPSSRPW